MAEEIKQKLKMDELKKRFREVEGENDLLQEKLLRAHKSIKRLRLERSILLERIDKGYDNGSDSDTNSDLLSHNELMMDKRSSQTHHHRHHHHHHHNKHHKQTEKNNSTTSTTVIKPPKKKKDPNAPKGPGNVFFVFCRQERDKIKEENPEESIGDVTRLLGLKWKGLTKEEKMFYYKIFKREMDEFEEAMKTYKSNGGGNLPLDEENTQRSQSVEDPVEELVITESLMSSPVLAASASPVSTNTDIIMQQQTQNNYQQNEHLYDHRFQNSFMVDNNHHQLYEPQPTFVSNNQENHLVQQHSHHHHHHHHHPIQQQPLQSTYVMKNNNAFEKPVTAHPPPPPAPYDHL